MKASVRRLERKIKRLVAPGPKNLDWVALGNGACKLPEVTMEVDLSAVDPKHRGFSFLWCKSQEKGVLFEGCPGCEHYDPGLTEGFKGEEIAESSVVLAKAERLSPTRLRLTFKDLSQSS